MPCIGLPDIYICRKEDTVVLLQWHALFLVHRGGSRPATSVIKRVLLKAEHIDARTVSQTRLNLSKYMLTASWFGSAAHSPLT